MSDRNPVTCLATVDDAANSGGVRPALELIGISKSFGVAAHSTNFLAALMGGCAVATTSTAQLDESKLIHLLVGSTVDKVRMSTHQRRLGNLTSGSGCKA